MVAQMVTLINKNLNYMGRHKTCPYIYLVKKAGKGDLKEVLSKALTPKNIYT